LPKSAPVAPARPNPTALKRACFVERFLVHFNATLAARDSGYSAKTARAQGCRLLTDADIQAAIAAGVNRRSAQAEISAERILEEVDQLATQDVGELLDFTGETPTIRAARDIPVHARRAIGSVKVRRTYRQVGEGKRARTVIATEDFEYKPWSKTESLRLALLRRGLLKNEGIDLNLHFIAEVPAVSPDGKSWQQQHAPTPRRK
jgi:hypothetical protein